MAKAEVVSDKKNPTILFVDDEPLSLKYFKASVGKYANVRTASSANAALEILETEGNDISIVVSDERMPRESGVSFLSDVRKSWPSTIRILTSAYANIDNLQHAINDAAIYRFVPKPWNLEELCAAMQDALLVEHSAVELAAPVLGSVSGGDAQDANLALLAILASGFDAPLASLDAEAFQLSQIGSQTSLNATPISTSYMASWSSRLKQAKVSTAAIQVRRDVEHCKSLAKSIKNLANSLANPAGIPSSSMADTLWEVMEQNSALAPAHPPFDAAQDFTYRVPREIMKFVLANVLRGGSDSRQKGTTALYSKIQLFTGEGHNEVRFTFEADQGAAALDERAWRTVRSSLWAFGGELLTSADEKQGNRALILCLPKGA